MSRHSLVCRSLPCRSLSCRSLSCRSLSCRSLPCRSLPCRAITLIREYSRPLTRPDWRKLHKLSNYDLYTIINKVTMSNVNLVIILQHHMIDTIWYKLFCFVRILGLVDASIFCNIPQEELLKMYGIQEAISQYKSKMYHMKRPYGFIQ